MRVSVRPDDPGYVPDPQRYTVFLDGTPLRYCVTADEETGEVWVYAKDSQGNTIIDGDTPIMTRKTGKVEVRRSTMDKRSEKSV